MQKCLLKESSMDRTPRSLEQGAAHNEPVVHGKRRPLALSRAAASLGPARMGGELGAGWGRRKQCCFSRCSCKSSASAQLHHLPPEKAGDQALGPHSSAV